jgi:hypothetical protein
MVQDEDRRKTDGRQRLTTQKETIESEVYEVFVTLTTLRYQG